MGTKTNIILNYLKEGNRITDVKAAEIAKSYRLSAIIYELRHRHDLDIQDRWLTNDQTGSRYKEYWLINKK